MNTFTFSIPTKIVFGEGELEELASTPLPGKKALIVITAGKSMKANGYLDRVRALLEKNNCTSIVFDKILPNPVKSHVMEGATLAKREGCDFLLGLGGGSSIDSAKAIAVMATNPGDYWDYISGGTGKGLPFHAKPLPVVAIPTTAGTGTEADPWTVVTNEERQEKIGFGCTETFPVLSIVDPELMLSVPPKLTAFQGFDAIFHSAEGYLANIATPLSDGFALQSLKLLFSALPVAVMDGKNMKARADVALGSTLAGLVESTSCCTSEHSLAHAMGALFPEIPHGAALLSISGEYFRFFSMKAPRRFMEMARFLGSPGKSPEEFTEQMLDLQKACGVFQVKMSDYGIGKDALGGIVENAYATMGGLFQLDRYELTFEDTLAILEKSWR